MISQSQNIKLKQVAKFYLTKAWGKTDQDHFLNTVIEIQTSLDPNSLLENMQAIEQSMGRVKNIKWGERIIDIDILLYGNQMVKQVDLIIPHPYISKRSFVLAPLFELNEKLKIPGCGMIKKLIHIDSIDKEIVRSYRCKKTTTS